VKALEAEAFEVIDRLMKSFPGNATPLALMGTVHERFGNGGEAMKWWTRCLKMDPRRADVHASMARFALGAGQYEQAVERWRKAMKIKPAIPGGRIGLGGALMGLGKAKEAVAILEEEIAAAPGRAKPHSLLGKAYLESGQFDKAEKQYRRAVSLQGDLTGAYYGLSMACARLGQKARAREYMEKFRKLKSRDRDNEVNRKHAYDDVPAVRQLVALAYTQAGMLYKGSGYLIQAEQHWDKAAALDPKNPICRAMLGSLYVRSLKYAKALKMYKQLVKMLPRNAGHHVRLGIIHGQLKQFDAALAALERAIELDPDNQQYRKIYQEIRQASGTPPGEGKKQ